MERLTCGSILFDNSFQFSIIKGMVGSYFTALFESNDFQERFRIPGASLDGIFHIWFACGESEIKYQMRFYW